MPVVSVSAEQASHMLAEGDCDLVDVREPHEWAAGHLPGARHVPLASFLRNPTQHLVQDKVMFVCAHGGRSFAAAIAAANHGMREVYNLDGGTVAWVQLGFPLEPA